MKSNTKRLNNKTHILIVEDSRTQAEKLQHLLEKNHYSVARAQNGKEALASLKKSSPALIISDIMMPQMDGYEMCRRIKNDEKLKDIPVILLTSLSDPDDIIHGLECGTDNFVVKPYDEKYLLTRIAHLLTNMELRKSDKVQMGVGIRFAGKDYVINSDRRQILDLLISTFESAVQQCHELKKVKADLKTVNEQLEKKVEERTLALKEEIAERRRMDAALRETNRQLENALNQLRSAQSKIIEQERLRALGQMASGIAHDFNNALSPILGFSELLLSDPENINDGKKVKKYLEYINISSRDAANVVSRLKEFYRPRERSEVFQSVDVNALIEKVVSLTRPRWKDAAQAKGVTVRVETNLSPVPPITAQENEMREALTNLIFNAVDAMPRGGTLTLSTNAEQDFVRVDVTDTGDGMDEDVRARCLEPFYSTKGDEGTGLGLSMVYGIVKRHEGKIEIQSAPGKGTTFKLMLPVFLETIVSETQTPENAKFSSTAKPLHILIVEDEDAVRDVVAAYVKTLGHSADVADSGRGGLEKLLSGSFDLIITDRGMPEMNGDQFAFAVKQHSPETPVILLTGFGDLMEAAGEKPDGVDEIVSKPCTLSALREAIAKVM